jgi:hypothetical protein
VGKEIGYNIDRLVRVANQQGEKVRILTFSRKKKAKILTG